MIATNETDNFFTRMERDDILQNETRVPMSESVGSIDKITLHVIEWLMGNIRVAME